MRTTSLIEGITPIFLLFIVACTQQVANPTNDLILRQSETNTVTLAPYPPPTDIISQYPIVTFIIPEPTFINADHPSPGPGKTNVATYTPYPPPPANITPQLTPTGIVTQPVEPFIVPDPLPGSDTMLKRAMSLLEPYFKNAPFLDQAVTSPPYMEYYGCVDSKDIGGIITYNIPQDQDTIKRQFNKYLHNYPIRTDGWKYVETPYSTGNAIVLSGRHIPETNLPLYVTFRATILDFGILLDQGNGQAYRSNIWIGITLIESTINYKEAENITEALVKICPSLKWWQHINLYWGDNP